uniref:Adenylate dimethylallyltransferase n=1 Tax=Pseudomonas savastanoi pv. savastanoi TaxID=360920 RepID=H1ZWU4_PSESS|nr:adenylate dimethylallyltransferase Ptz [Pseudomonas savastanoi]CBZ39944.1 isopentenyl transferase [Pseudomonas savastanoi pv. savastanoi]
MKIYLIWGATCTGKTEHSIKLSKSTGWPVIVLDRVQCCFDIATGSGRPHPEELQSTRRIYLDNRRISEGVISAEEANDRLKLKVNKHIDSGGVILEGGSISLLKLISKDPYWCDRFIWSQHRMRLQDTDVFMDKAKARVRRMLVGSTETTGLLDELVAAQSDLNAKLAIQDIDGYRYIMNYAQARRLSITQLLNVMTGDMKEELINGIALEYYEHAKWQERDFPAEWLAERSTR